MVESIWEGYVTSEQIADEAAKDSADLIPNGWYEGVILSHKTSLNEQQSPLNGMPVAQVRVELYGVGERTRQMTDFLTGAEARWPEGNDLMRESRLGNLLARATGTLGKQFSESLDAATQARCLYRVGTQKGRDGGEPRNRIYGIRPVGR